MILIHEKRGGSWTRKLKVTDPSGSGSALPVHIKNYSLLCSIVYKCLTSERCEFWGTTTRCSAPSPTKAPSGAPYNTPPSHHPNLPPIGNQHASTCCKLADYYQQCCGSGSMWIRIEIAPLDQDPYWENGSGSREVKWRPKMKAW